MGNVEELFEKLDEKVTELGIDPRFKENPAYKKVLFEVQALIMEMNMDSYKDISFRKNDGVILFVYNPKDSNKKYSFELSAPGKDELRCISTCESTNYNMGKTPVQEKFVVEVESKLDNMGKIVITSEYGKANSLDCGFGECNVWRAAERKTYDAYGVEEKREIESYPTHKVNRDVSHTGTYDVIRGERRPFDVDYVRRTRVVRNMLDVVDVWHEDKKTGEKYSGLQEMHSEHGLQDLDFSYRFDQSVVIHPLMTAEIEEMLSKENPKVAEGLRKYAEGREKFEYDSEKTTEHEYRASY